MSPGRSPRDAFRRSRRRRATLDAARVHAGTQLDAPLTAAHNTIAPKRIARRWPLFFGVFYTSHTLVRQGLVECFLRASDHLRPFTSR